MGRSDGTPRSDGPGLIARAGPECDVRPIADGLAPTEDRPVNPSRPLCVVIAPTRAFLDYLHGEHEIMLPVGTTLRLIGDLHMGDPCCDIAIPLDGPWAGAAVVIEDAASLVRHGRLVSLAPERRARERLGMGIIGRWRAERAARRLGAWNANVHRRARESRERQAAMRAEGRDFPDCPPGCVTDWSMQLGTKPDEFRRVDLTGAAQRCAQCVFYAYEMGHTRHQHGPDHAHETRLPRRWRVVGEVHGDPIPVDTNLVLVDTYGASSQDSVGSSCEDYFVLEALDGPRAGEVFWVLTRTEVYGDEWDRMQLMLPDDPRWPTGLAPEATAP